jgi:glycosyltransferase involved in cell wall biosynthesis
LVGIKDDLDKIVVLHNGVLRTNKIMPKKLKQIIYVGRIVKEKGVDLFVDAIKEIHEDFKDWNFKIIGSPKLGINKLDKFSIKIKKDFESIGKRAKMTGFIDSKKLNKIMSDTAVIVIPSVWNEPFGLVAAEAMSNGVAVISSNSGGLPEIIRDNGILIKNINSKKIARQLKKIISDTSLLKDLQKKSWKNFSFDSKKISSKLDNHRQELFLKN